jgi:hypothetical protein
VNAGFDSALLFISFSDLSLLPFLSFQFVRRLIVDIINIIFSLLPPFWKEKEEES